MKTTTIRMEDAVLERVDSLAKALNRSRTWVVNQAVQRFLGYEEWFIHEVNSGIREAENGDLASDKEVEERFARWSADAD